MPQARNELPETVWPAEMIEAEIKRYLDDLETFRIPADANHDTYTSAWIAWRGRLSTFRTFLLVAFTGDQIASQFAPLGYSENRLWPHREKVRQFGELLDHSTVHAKTLLDQLGYFKPYRDDESVPVQYSKQKVFVVHGRDGELREAAARLVERLGLEPVVLNEQANEGATLLEKLEANADVGFAIVLFSPDDEGRLANSEEPLERRPRQNVIYEAGYFVGRLSRKRVAFVGGHNIPGLSDLAGLVTIPPAGTGWMYEVARELKAAGYDVDMNKI